MTYVVSDLHGYSLDRFQRVLDKIGFSADDKLYVLGDCIDRGNDGIKIIRFLMTKPNIKLLRGNHEQMLLDNRFIFETEKVLTALDLVGEERKNYCMWMSNGGCITIESMRQYTTSQTKYILNYINKTLLYKEISVGGKKYILVHSGLGNFEKSKQLSEYSSEDLLWTRPTLDTKYYDDGTIVVFGHTPTVMYGENFKGKIVITKTWIDIDVGAGMGLSPVLLRLDDMSEFYF